MIYTRMSVIADAGFPVDIVNLLDVFAIEIPVAIEFVLQADTDKSRLLCMQGKHPGRRSH